MSKRAKPELAKPRRRWDRKRWLTTLLALFLVMIMLLSSLAILFAR